MERMNLPWENCLHLQLYRDSKDRYKQGQTKASLSLQHFLGVETGFTLDKESNTIAILCQDVTVVLAFDTRERLIQWQVKIANNLGEDQQFLVQISSAPQKAKIAPGPARLHVQEYRFCITMGVPPRLVGVWEISKLRRYGVVESRFCFEGGSRCGKGEGLYVFITDQGEEITRTLQAASEGKMSVRRRPASRNMSVMDSPRKCSTRMSSIGGDTMSLCQRSLAGDSGMDCQSICRSVMHNTDDHETSSVWPSSETRTNVSDFGDTSSVGDCADTHSQECHNWVEPGIGRCASCISKLGALSRSSTAGNSTGAGFSPAWTMDSPANCQGKDRPNYSQSVSSQDSAASEYSVPRQQNEIRYCRVASPCDCDGPPSRPPKSEQLRTSQDCNNSVKSSAAKIQYTKKPPMPLPNQNYGNYDIPKTIFPQENNTRCHTPQSTASVHGVAAAEYYDTPKAIKECLAYSNYDRPQMVASAGTATLPPAAAGPGWCLTGAHQTRVVLEEDSSGCPCRRLVCWPANWISLPYCRRGSGIENTSVHLHKVKLSGEGKMPIVNKCGGLAIYATVDKSKKLKYRKPEDMDVNKEAKENDSGNVTISSNYVNLDPNNKETNAIEERLLAPANYENLDFAQSLEYYENSKEVLQKTSDPCFSVDRHGVKFCTKCGHACSNSTERGGGSSDEIPTDDYLMMEPQRKTYHHQSVKFPGYIPMHPFKPEIFKSSWRKSRGLFERAASIPSLSDRGRRLSCDAEPTGRRPSGSAMLSGHTQSANSSPYLMRRRPPVQSPCPKKRSNSVDSTRYDDDDETLRCSQETVESELCPPLSGNKDEKSENEVVCGGPEPIIELESPSEMASVQVRRSSSVPCKPSNRDSSSSNDSGVSTGSLKHRGGDFAEFELPLTTSMSSRRLLLAQQPGRTEDCCLHASLPRRSKSSDPMKELSFQFPRVKVPAKSSSAEAEVPICHGKREPKDYSSPNGDGAIVVPYIDSRSTSSGTSDMSDYIETLSLSSHSSSDTPDSLRLGRIPVTTLRPRSGKEYHKIDRYILEEDVKAKGQVITTVLEKSKSPSPGYMSSSPGN